MLWDSFQSCLSPLSFAINTFIVFAQMKKSPAILAKLFFCNLFTQFLHTLKTVHPHIIIHSCNQLITFSSTSQKVSFLADQPKAHCLWHTNNRVSDIRTFPKTFTWSFNSIAFKSYGQLYIIIIIEKSDRDRERGRERERVAPIQTPTNIIISSLTDLAYRVPIDHNHNSLHTRTT